MKLRFAIITFEVDSAIALDEVWFWDSDLVRPFSDRTDPEA